jgi:hypothetical protein
MISPEVKGAKAQKRTRPSLGLTGEVLNRDFPANSALCQNWAFH